MPLVLAALSDAATTKTDQIVETLATIGIRPKLPALEDVGGPLLPPVDGIESTSLVDEANDVAAALERYRAARSAAGVAPAARLFCGSVLVAKWSGGGQCAGDRRDAPCLSSPCFSPSGE